MLFSFGPYRMDVDVEKTSAFYQSNAVLTSEQCTCGGCQNYDKAILQASPTVLQFLRDFGIDPQKPGEVFGYTGEIDADQTYWYSGWYHIVGTILDQPPKDKQETSENCYQPDPTFDFRVWFTDNREQMGWINKEFPRPMFEMSISTHLPWVI
jgi:hypothetical protein